MPRKKAIQLTAEERESLGKWARRVVQAVKENEKAAGKEVGTDDLKPWHELGEAEKEVYRQSGVDLDGGAIRSEQFMLAQLARTREMMGEKAFRERMYHMAVGVVLERVAQGMDEHEREKAVEIIVKMAGMLEVPPANPLDDSTLGRS